MVSKSNEEVKEVIAKVIADAATNPGLSKALSENHLKVLSRPPYHLTLKDLITAHDTHPNLRPADPPWGAVAAGRAEDADRADDLVADLQPSGQSRGPRRRGQPSDPWNTGGRGRGPQRDGPPDDPWNTGGHGRGPQRSG